MTEKVRVAIVGCGLIGAMWDTPESAKERALTHAGAFSKLEQAQIIAFCDSDVERAKAACARWQVPYAYTNLQTMLEECKPQIVVVATASDARLELLKTIVVAGVKLCIIEKPLATTLEESERIVAWLGQGQTMAIVNYSRNWDFALQDLGVRLRAGEWGRVQRLQGWYGKGIANNGSHMIDMVCSLLAAKPFAARGRWAPLPDQEAKWSEGRDRAFDAQVRYGGGHGEIWQLDMLASDQNAYSCFELRIMLEKAILEIRQGGRSLSLTPIVDDPDFKNYRIPGQPQQLAAGYLQAMENMAQEALDLVRGQRSHPRCDAQQALLTARTVQIIRASALQDIGQDSGWHELDNEGQEKGIVI